MISNLGRTEDIRFSPSGRRLAVAAFGRNRIAVFEVDFSSGHLITFLRAAEISSPVLRNPHGVDFLDEDRIIVANRLGAAPILNLPPLEETPRTHTVLPSFTIPADATTGLYTPGSVAAITEAPGRHTLIFCNNYANTVTRHTLHADGSTSGSQVLLQRDLETPDGVAISPDRRWLAISNHDRRSVFVFALDAELGPESEPQAILRGLQYPHGLRFTADGCHLVVADAGAPLVHIYRKPEECWRGVCFPSLSHRVMSDEVFLRGRYNAEEGGIKGLDIAPGHSVLAVTSEHQPLAFFDLGSQLELSEVYAAIG
ncbi:hypothetical protein [Aestuariivirga sp.]|uniref:hypothetical protein n=1 Tax=Aestuariivirga sp. TaxID=2650926 RepID=UPI00391CD377